MPNRIPVIMGITTLPSRIAHMRPCLESLLDGLQVPDKIYISAPQVSLREKTGYDIPAFFLESRFAEKIEILHPEQDFGPGTKLLGMLGKITEPSYVVIADDDVLYRRFFLRRLIEYQRTDHHASFSWHVYSLAGLRVGQGVDGFSFWSPNLEGVWDFYETYVAGTDLMFHDDLWISFFLMSRAIPVQTLRFLLEEAGLINVRSGEVHDINALLNETGNLSRQKLHSLVCPLFARVNVAKEIYGPLLIGKPDDLCICGSGKLFADCHA